jgi:hypothetical protein
VTITAYFYSVAGASLASPERLTDTPEQTAYVQAVEIRDRIARERGVRVLLQTTEEIK